MDDDLHPIDWKKYDKMTLAEKWAYLNNRTKEIHEKVQRIRQI